MSEHPVRVAAHTDVVEQSVAAAVLAGQLVISVQSVTVWVEHTCQIVNGAGKRQMTCTH